MQTVILAAGSGTRMQPLTGKTSKVMLPIANKPMLAWLIDTMRTVSDEIILVINKDQSDIQKAFPDCKFVVQKNKLGTADALRYAEGMVSGKFIVKNGDELIDEEDLRKFSESPPYTVACFRVKEPWRFGVFSLNEGKIVDIVEKPERPPSNLINAGMYLADERIFDAIRNTPVSDRGEYEITDTWKMMIQSGIDYKPFVLSKWNTIGYPWHFFDANRLLLDKTGSMIKSTISSNVKVEQPVAIGPNTEIGDGSFVSQYSSIGENCKIGRNVFIENSVLMNNCYIADEAVIRDSIVGENVKIGAGTILENKAADGTVKMWVSGKLVDSGRQTLGSVIGHNTVIGKGIKINAGTRIDPDSEILVRSFG